MLQVETMITEGNKLKTVNPMDVMGINATKLFKANLKKIRAGYFVKPQKVPGSDSLFSFLSLGDGTIVMGKIKDGNPIFERYSIN